MSKFYPKPAKFESKSQIAPNAIVFHTTLSESAKILLLALNAIATCTYSWVPVQSDLQLRLRWTKKRMLNAIKDAMMHGYLIVRQSRDCEKKKGRFSTNEFEWDMEPSYINTPEVQELINTGSRKKPQTQKRHTVNPHTEKEPQPNLREEPSLKEQQTEPVVCSFDYDKKRIADSNEILDLLKPFAFSRKVLDELCMLPLSQVKEGLKAYYKWAESNKPSSVLATVRSAIQGTKNSPPWTYKETKQEILDREEKEKFDLIEANRSLAYDIYKKYDGKFHRHYYLEVKDTCVHLKVGESMSILGFMDPDFKKTIEYFLSQG